jgi:pilus assembly protein CpaB
MSGSLRTGVIGLMLLTTAVLGIFIFNLSRPVPVQTVTAMLSPAPAPLQTAYLVAEHPLPAGTLARDNDFKSVLATTVPADAIVDTAEARSGLRGSLIRTYLDAGMPITNANVLRPRDRGFVASVLAPGTRAVTVAVDAVSGVAGLIWPGDHVDIILTQDIDKETPARHTLSETVLTNIRVIAIDQEIVQGAPTDASAAGRLVRTVTLEVDPAQAEKTTVAAHIGKLTLAIRAAVDQATDQDAELPNRTTYGADVSPALARADRPTRVTGTVTVLTGGKLLQVFPVP